MQVGDVVVVQPSTDEAIKALNDICGTSTLGKTMTISDDGYTWRGFKCWRLGHNTWIIPEICLVLVSEAPKPKPHLRGLSLSRFAVASFPTTARHSKHIWPKPTVVVPRCKELRALHGTPLIRLVCQNALPNWFSNMVNYSGISFNSTTKLVTKANGQSLKATKWLSNVGVEEAKVQELAKALNDKTFDLILSCKYKDLLRCSISRNFHSCWNDDSNTYELLERPNVAIAGTKDKHGDYVSRWIVWWDAASNRIITNPVPYPQKYNWAEAYALTDKVQIWNSYGAQTHPQRTNFNVSIIQTHKLYDESDKGSLNFIRPLSLASSQVNSEQEKGTVE